MKNFLKEILKPIAIFSIYLSVVALLSNIIVVYFNTNISIVSLTILILTYPIYLYLINYN
jgi:predicted membrane metal-binding protein